MLVPDDSRARSGGRLLGCAFQLYGIDQVRATTVNDMYCQLDSLAQAAEDIGIRAVLSNDVALPEHNIDSLRDNHDAHKANHSKADGRIEVWIGIEWLPLASPELLREARAMADDLGAGIHVHLNKSKTGVEFCLEKFGWRPTELGYETGLLGPDTVACTLCLAQR